MHTGRTGAQPRADQPTAELNGAAKGADGGVSGHYFTPRTSTFTSADWPRARELPVPVGDGKVSVDDRNARSLDNVTICLQGPMSSLGATATTMRSYRSRTLKGKPPFPSAVLDRQPDTYAVALQFADAIAAMTAKSTVG